MPTRTLIPAPTPTPAPAAATAASTPVTSVLPLVPAAAAAGPRPRAVAVTAARLLARSGRLAKAPSGVAKVLLGAAVPLVPAVIVVGDGCSCAK
jgi:hypothetical protein